MLPVFPQEAQDINRSDPYYNKVVIHIPGDTVIKDLKGGSITNTNVTLSQFKPFGTSSMYFSSANLLTVGSTISSTTDFTVEALYYLTNAGDIYQSVIEPYGGNPGFSIRYGNSGFGYKLQMQLDTGSVLTCYSVPYTQYDHQNKWTHVAFQRRNGLLHMFVNGVLTRFNYGANPATYDYTYYSSAYSFTNRQHYISAGSFAGYIKEVRFTIDVARYTGNFIVPNMPFPTRGGQV